MSNVVPFETYDQRMSRLWDELRSAKLAQLDNNTDENQQRVERAYRQYVAHCRPRHGTAALLGRGEHGRSSTR